MGDIGKFNFTKVVPESIWELAAKSGYSDIGGWLLAEDYVQFWVEKIYGGKLRELRGLYTQPWRWERSESQGWPRRVERRVPNLIWSPPDLEWPSLLVDKLPLGLGGDDYAGSLLTWKNSR